MKAPKSILLSSVLANEWHYAVLMEAYYNKLQFCFTPFMRELMCDWGGNMTFIPRDIHDWEEYLWSAPSETGTKCILCGDQGYSDGYVTVTSDPLDDTPTSLMNFQNITPTLECRNEQCKVVREWLKLRSFPGAYEKNSNWMPLGKLNRPKKYHKRWLKTNRVATQDDAGWYGITKEQFALLLASTLQQIATER